MFLAPRLLCLLTLLTAAAVAVPALAQAPVVSSAVSGVVFQDAPRSLPVDTRFSQAVQTVGIDLGMSCEQVEAFGWTITPDQQDRVNDIFTQTAQELARLGYTVTPQTPSSAAADITVYTATRANKDVLFMWSAGTTGLLLLTCDARVDVAPRGFGPGASTAAAAGNDGARPVLQPDDLVGEWVGTYSCLGQGPTGGTLTVSRVRHDKDGYGMSGLFSFYPLKDKNPNQPRGSYRFSGRYNAEAQRAILEPGAWLQRPKDYYDAVMAAQFNAVQRRVSIVFEGTTGCTSFEAAYKDGSAGRALAKADDDKPVVKKKKPKPVAQAEPVMDTPAVDSIPAADLAPAASAIPAQGADSVMPATTANEVNAPGADGVTITESTSTVITPSPSNVETPSPAPADSTAAPTAPAADAPVTVPEKPPVL